MTNCQQPTLSLLTSEGLRLRGLRRSGFTLVEICIAMALAMMLLGISTLAISGLQDEAKLKRTASQMESTARQSLQKAVMDQRLIEVTLDAGSFGGEGSLQVKRLGEKAFRLPRRGEVWEFSPTGVCEPLDIRLTSAGGTIELGFDPLTGCAVRKSVIVKG
jgi:type II secretory pathway pseudopilin PulG